MTALLILAVLAAAGWVWHLVARSNARDRQARTQRRAARLSGRGRPKLTSRIWRTWR